MIVRIRWITDLHSVRIHSNMDDFEADDVTLAMLVNHTALGMHYVFGFPIQFYSDEVQPIHLLEGSGLAALYGYKKLLLEKKPGSKFSYSGGGFVVLQYLLEELEKKPIEEITRDFLDGCGLTDFSFSQSICSCIFLILHFFSIDIIGYYCMAWQSHWMSVLSESRSVTSPPRRKSILRWHSHR